MTAMDPREPVFRREVFSSPSPSRNPRIPPIMAKHSSIQLPCKLALLSHAKLQQEAASRQPNLRRCLAHNTLLHRSLEVATQDINTRMKRFHFDEDDSIRAQPIAVKKTVAVKKTTSTTTETFTFSANATPELAPEQQPSPIREHITTTVKAMIRRRSGSPKPGQNDRNDLVRAQSQDRHLPSSSDRKLMVRSRRYAAKLVPSRKLWSHSPVLTSAAG